MVHITKTVLSKNVKSRLFAVFSIIFCGFISTIPVGAISYTIEYKENVSSNMPENVLNGLSSSTSVLLPANTPLRAGYRFIGWCDQATTKNGSMDVCATGHQYQPNELFTINATTINNIKLNAMWKDQVTFDKAYADAGKTRSGDYYVMQDMTPSICTEVDSGEVGEVKDSRDGTVYQIGKLPDGKCWMLNNLALDLVTNVNNLNENNTNASNNTLSYLKGTATGTSSDRYAMAAVANGTSGSVSKPFISTTNKNTTNSSDSLGSDARTWKYGIQYNYCATTAGGYCYGQDSSMFGSPSGDATESICPKGWRLPGGGDTINLSATPPTGEYANLYGYYSGSNQNRINAFRTALQLPLSGYFTFGTTYQGADTYYWSSTLSNEYYMLALQLKTNSVSFSSEIMRTIGASIRCISES